MGITIALKSEYLDIPGIDHVTAIALAQIIYWRKTMGRKFYKTDKDFSDELRLTLRQFERVKKKIKELGFIHVTREQIPAKTFYDIDYEGLERAIRAVDNSSENAKKGETLPTENVETSTHDARKTTHQNVETNTKNTTKITTEKEQCWAWASKHDYWASRCPDKTAFLSLYEKNTPNGLRAQWEQLKPKHLSIDRPRGHLCAIEGCEGMGRFSASTSGGSFYCEAHFN